MFLELTVVVWTCWFSPSLLALCSCVLGSGSSVVVGVRPEIGPDSELVSVSRFWQAAFLRHGQVARDRGSKWGWQTSEEANTKSEVSHRNEAVVLDRGTL